MALKTTRRDFVGAVAPVIFASCKPARSTSPGAAAESRAVVLAYRISPSQWNTDAQFRRLLDFLAANRAGVDEISLFDEDFPRPARASLEALAGLTDAWGRRISQLHSAGYRAGINVLWTLGHQDVPDVPLPKMPFQPMVGHDGRASNACMCPNDPAFRNYIRERYRAAARAKPDFIWVDDDFRMSHHGVLYPCFCPICLGKFGRQRDRAALVRQLNSPAEGEIRRAWTEFCASSLESLAGDIGRAVREVDPGIDVGLMTIGYSHSTYAGYPFTRAMRALAANRGRPGHGYYSDETPRALIGKTLDVGRQVRDYPAEVKAIQYELENYPYIELDKAARTVLNECTLALMMGCNGIAFNALKECAGTLDDYAPLMRAIAAERPVWNGLLAATKGLQLSGLWPADHPLLMANRTVDAAGWFNEGPLYNIQQPNQLAEIGIAFTPDRRSACGVILAGKVAEGFSVEELRAILSGGVLLDGTALEVLWNRGLGELTGVKPGEKFRYSVLERFSDHPMNGSDRGDGREALIGPADNTCSLVPVASDVASLASLVRYDGKNCGSCFSIFTNRLNGRVAVASYSPWRRLGRGAKRRQLIAVTDWLTRGTLPVIIEQTVRVAPFVRLDRERRRVALVLFNMGFDPSGPLTLRLRAQPKSMRLITAHGTQDLVVRQTAVEVRVDVPSLPPWHAAALAGT